jgi:DNA repair exonuclease SbcCD nuclease subunit
MPRITFIHTADIHLDTPFKGLSEVDSVLATRLKQATFQAFRRVVDHCLQEPADFLLIAGDTFDGETRSLSAQLGFADELRRLSEADIPVYMVFGNHDPAEAWLKELSFPKNVHCFSPDHPDAFTFSRNGQPLADIHGLSFDSRLSGDNPTALFKRSDRPAPFSIALLHGTIGPAGPHAPYSPFTANDILDKGFDYWALGHIHRQRIIRGADPAIVYPGNPQGRDFGETGPKGCCRVVLETGGKPDITVIPTDMVRFETMFVDLSEADTLNLIPEKIEQALYDSGLSPETAGCVCRIVLRGRTPLHSRLNNEAALADLAQRLNETQTQKNYFHIDRIESETLPDIDLDSIVKGHDFPAEVLRTIRRHDDDPVEINHRIRSLAETFGTPGIRKEIDALNDDACREIVALAQRKLIDLFFT